MSPENALGQYDRIATAILNLNYLPERYEEIHIELWKQRGLRRMNVDHYSVFFYIRQHSVIVTNVLYGASDIEKHLKK